jgi:hypothetical protein
MTAAVLERFGTEHCADIAFVRVPNTRCCSFSDPGLSGHERLGAP